MYKLPELSNTYVDWLVKYIELEGFININNVKMSGDKLLTYHIRDNINEYITLPDRVIVDSYNVILSYGYMGFLDICQTAIEYFSSYNDDYIPTVLEQMDDGALKDKVSSDELLNYIKMFCYYHRVSEYKIQFRRFIHVIETTYL